MPKGNNFTAPVTPADVTAASAAIKALQAKVAFVPQQPESVLSNTTLTPERLPLADLALKVANEAPDVMRKSCDPDLLQAKIAAYRAVDGLIAETTPVLQRLLNGRQVLGSDIVFMAGNIHEDVENDNGETVDLGPLRQELHAYYTRPAARKPKSKPAQ